MRSAAGIDNEYSISRAPIQRALRVFGYHSDTRVWGAESRRNPEEFTMSHPDSSTDIDASENASRSGRKRGRPLTGGQEAVFFAITFAVAFGFQLAVILKVADVIAW